MDITTAKYLQIDGKNSAIYVVTKDNRCISVPLDQENASYTEIMRQVDAGELTIDPAE